MVCVGVFAQPHLARNPFLILSDFFFSVPKYGQKPQHESLVSVRILKWNVFCFTETSGILCISNFIFNSNGMIVFELWQCRPQQCLYFDEVYHSSNFVAPKNLPQCINCDGAAGLNAGPT